MLQAKLADDDALASAHAEFLQTIKSYPGATPHFGIRYRSMQAVDQVIEQLKSVSEELKRRVSVDKIPPSPTRPGMQDIRRVFVQSDVISTNPAGFGQTIELQVERSAS